MKKGRREVNIDSELKDLYSPKKSWFLKNRKIRMNRAVAPKSHGVFFEVIYWVGFFTVIFSFIYNKWFIFTLFSGVVLMLLATAIEGMHLKRSRNVQAFLKKKGPKIHLILLFLGLLSFIVYSFFKVNLIVDFRTQVTSLGEGSIALNWGIFTLLGFVIGLVILSILYILTRDYWKRRVKLVSLKLTEKRFKKKEINKVKFVEKFKFENFYSKFVKIILILFLIALFIVYGKDFAITTYVWILLALLIIGFIYKSFRRFIRKKKKKIKGPLKKEEVSKKIEGKLKVKWSKLVIKFKNINPKFIKSSKVVIFIILILYLVALLIANGKDFIRIWYADTVLVLLILYVIFLSFRKFIKKKIGMEKVKINYSALTLKKFIVANRSKNETDLDILYKLINKEGRVKISVLAKAFDVKKDIIEEWGKILEDSKLITLDYPPFGDLELCKK